MCFAPLPDALRPLHPNLSKFQFSSFLTFLGENLRIWWSKFRRGVLRDEFLLIFWIEHDHISSTLILCTVELHSRNYTQVFLKIPQNRFSYCSVLVRGVPSNEFLWYEKFFHQKVWVLQNIFHIYHVFISPIDLEL